METSGNRKIFVGIPRERFTYNSFVDNRDHLFARLQELGLYAGYFVAEGHRVDRNRTGIVKAFLDDPGKADWLLQIDSDMEHPIMGPETLLAAAEELDAKIIAGLYFHRGSDHQPFFFRYFDKPANDQWGRPTQVYVPMRDEVYDFLEDCGVPMQDGPFIVQDAPYSPILRCDAVATGLMLVHRSVFERMEPPWFEYYDPSQSEDLLFCDRVNKELGEPIYGHMGVCSGHITNTPIGHAQFRTIHSHRGFTYGNIDRRLAEKWANKWFPEEGIKAVEDYTTETMSNVWTSKDRDASDKTIEFYQDEAVGREYIKDLIRWNGDSDMFTAMRRQLVPIRAINVLEIGPGIGTMMVQLAFQRCNVTAVEPNPVLQQFIKERWEDLMEEDEGCTITGSIRMTDKLENVDGTYRLCIAIDVFEHVHRDELPEMLKAIGRLLPKRARLFFHNNFKMQDIYPFHYDHSLEFEQWLKDAGFFQLDDLWAIKVED